MTFQRGIGHAGDGMYCWLTEYPEEGAFFVDGSTATPAEAVSAPSPADERTSEAVAIYQILTEDGTWLDVPHRTYEKSKSNPALTRVVYTIPKTPEPEASR
ncbi:hypothetical protein [Burkholderia cepacia]|uniref:hypothetical protein n=1 Tax=Burkholderia cepacia TaxID=292 RepID=UPI00398EA5AD